jgi:hypothetical protein
MWQIRKVEHIWLAILPVLRVPIGRWERPIVWQREHVLQ